MSEFKIKWSARPTKKKTAYVQCSWKVREASDDGARRLEEYEEMVEELAFGNIVNIATWAYDEPSRSESAGRDAVRNLQQLEEADMLISVFDDEHPKFHWGSLAVLAAGLAMNKQCYVIASDKSSAWGHHMMKHPFIKRAHNVHDIIVHNYAKVSRRNS